MERKVIEAAVIMADVNEQHFKGGYYSESVRSVREHVRDLLPEAKRQLYKDVFNRVWDLATGLLHSEKYSLMNGGIDLTKEGLGIIAVDLQDDLIVNEADRPYKTLNVSVTAFDPTEEKIYRIHYGDSPLQPIEGVEEIPVSIHPRHWGDDIYAWEDGSFIQEGQGLEIDQEILRVLDFEETLRVAQEVITATPVSV